MSRVIVQEKERCNQKLQTRLKTRDEEIQQMLKEIKEKDTLVQDHVQSEVEDARLQETIALLQTQLQV